jgi:hypothetical protein
LLSAWIRRIGQGISRQLPTVQKRYAFEPHLEGELWGRIISFLAITGPMRNAAPATTRWGDSQPAAVIPADLQSTPANVMDAAAEAFFAAFGNERINELVSELQSLHLSDQLITSLLRVTTISFG